MSKVHVTQSPESRAALTTTGTPCSTAELTSPGQASELLATRTLMAATTWLTVLLTPLQADMVHAPQGKRVVDLWAGAATAGEPSQVPRVEDTAR